MDGTWFLLDALFEGNTLVQPKCIDDVLLPLSLTTSLSYTIAETVLDATIIALIAIPGYFTTVYKLGCQNPRYFQSQRLFVTLVGITKTNQLKNLMATRAPLEDVAMH